MSPSPKDMPRRLPLHTIFRTPKEEEPKPTWADDLRWKRDDIWAEIAPFPLIDATTMEDGSLDPRIGKTQLMIEVRFGGQVFYSRTWVAEDELEDIPYILNLMVENIDAIMEEHGFPPYKIERI